MLAELERRIEDVDILTDFDETIIKENSYYLQYFAYLSYLIYNLKLGKFAENLLKSIKIRNEFKKDENFFALYSIFEGCPVEVLDKTVKRLNQNEEWENLIEKLNLEKIGVVSRNNYRIIHNYLKNLKEKQTKINIVAANILKIKENFYTGEVKINVNNKNLIDFVKKKEYVCGEDEKRILENYNGLNFEKMKFGLYVFYKKSFSGFDFKEPSKNKILVGNNIR